MRAELLPVVQVRTLRLGGKDFLIGQVGGHISDPCLVPSTLLTSLLDGEWEGLGESITHLCSH